MIDQLVGASRQGPARAPVAERVAIEVEADALRQRGNIARRLLKRYDIDPEFVFREAGLDPALMEEPRGRDNVERVMKAWAKSADLINDPCFGLKAAEVWSPTDMQSRIRSYLPRAARFHGGQR